jgi:hypothetical protein
MTLCPLYNKEAEAQIARQPRSHPKENNLLLFCLGDERQPSADATGMTIIRPFRSIKLLLGSSAAVSLSS